MDDRTDREWQALHHRSASGETLDAEEQAAYDAGCRDLDAGERLDGDVNRLRTLRAQIAQAQAEQQQLRRQEAALDARVAALFSCRP